MAPGTRHKVKKIRPVEVNILPEKSRVFADRLAIQGCSFCVSLLSARERDVEH